MAMHSFRHTSSTTRYYEVDVPEDELQEVDGDLDQWFYQFCDETDGDIVGGSWEIDEVDTGEFWSPVEDITHHIIKGLG